jgi:hypothetical protein
MVKESETVFSDVLFASPELPHAATLKIIAKIMNMPKILLIRIVFPRFRILNLYLPSNL